MFTDLTSRVYISRFQTAKLPNLALKLFPFQSYVIVFEELTQVIIWLSKQSVPAQTAGTSCTFQGWAGSILSKF